MKADPKTAGPNGLPLTIRLLSEHLDMVLAAGEDLSLLAFQPRDEGCSAGADGPESGVGYDEIGPRSLAEFANGVQTLEIACALRVLSARDRASDLAEEDARFRHIIRLFLGGTRPLLDCLDQLRRPGGDIFKTGDCPVQYFRTRGLIASDAAGPDPFKPLRVTDAFRIGAAIELGPLMDMTAAFLDAIEIHFEVFPERPDERLTEEWREEEAHPALSLESVGSAIAALEDRVPTATSPDTELRFN